MSSYYHLYKVAAPDLSQLPRRDGAIDADGCECRIYDASGEVPGWVTAIGAQSETVTSRLDLFAAGEDLFGRKPTSVSTGSYDLSYYRYHFADGTFEDVDRGQLEPYYEDVRYPAFLVEAEEIGSVDSCRVEALEPYDESLIGADELEGILRGYMEEYGEDLEDEWSGSHYTYPLYMLLKGMFAARDGYDVVCERS